MLVNDDDVAMIPSFVQSYLPIGLITVAACAYGYHAMVSKKAQLRAKPIPTAPGGMIATIHNMAGKESIWYFQRCVQQMGTTIFKLNLPIPNVYVVGKASYQREILLDKTTDKPYSFYKGFEMLLGAPTTISRKTSDVRWKQLRKGVAPAFSSTEVSRMNRICQYHVQEWIEKELEPLVGDDSKTFDPSAAMTRLTFKTICEAGFEYRCTDEEYEEYAQCMQVTLREFSFRQITNPLRRTFRHFIPSVREAYAGAGKVQAFGYRVLAAYRKNPNKSTTSNTLIRMIENNPHNLTDKEKASEISLFMAAGQDTTGYSLANMLVLLAKHPEEMKKVQDSLWKEKVQKSQLNNSDQNKIQHLYKTLKPSGYLRQVMTEASRLLPVGALGSVRETGRVFEFRDKEDDPPYIIPKGAATMLVQYLAHHDPEVFGDPEVFRPDRWNSPTKEMLSSVMTFSAGVRNCVGQSLATAELNSVLSTLFLNYDFEVAEPGLLQYFLSLKYVGCQLRVKRATLPAGLE